MELVYSLNISQDCFISLAQVYRGVEAKQIWAFKFVDAWGKIPTGIAEGSIAHFGEYDECLEIDHQSKRMAVPIKGQYCLAKFVLPYPSMASIAGHTTSKHLVGRDHYEYLVDFLKVYNLDKYLTLQKLVELLNNQRGATLRLGTCFPDACTPGEFELILNKLLFPLTSMPIELEPDCYSLRAEETRSMDGFEVAAV